MVLRSLALDECRDAHKERKDMSFCRLVAEFHLAGKFFEAQERPRSDDEEKEDDWLNIGDARFESDRERRFALTRCDTANFHQRARVSARSPMCVFAFC